jgi:hypothetical protein
MARGGARTGAGRPPDIHTKLSPDAVDRARARIQTDSIIQRLTKAVAGEIDMKASAVSAALGLLRKVMPDLSESKNQTEMIHRFVARVPEKAESAAEWQKTYSPERLTIQ